MGRMNAIGMAENATLEQGIRWHLACNHYPPIPEVTESAVRAVKRARRGDWGKVRLPDGVTYRGEKMAPISACIEGWHLEPWLEGYEGE